MKKICINLRTLNALHCVLDPLEIAKVSIRKRLKFTIPNSKSGPCKIVLGCILAFHLFCVAGCNGPVLSSAEQIREFEKAGLAIPAGDVNEPTKARLAYTYRVVPGDVLELYMPAILSELSSDSLDWLQKVEPYLCRVSNAGTITLPTVGKIPVAGKTLTEIESSVVEAYFPKYVINLPAVVCKVAEHRNQRVFAVLGLVKKPNAFEYPANLQYNLMDALALAGGIDMIADPRYATIYRQEENGEIVSATFGIGSKSLADASNVMVKPGDVVSVDITPRTRTNVWVAQMLRFSFGTYVRAEDL